jgi:hypothetical protein
LSVQAVPFHSNNTVVPARPIPVATQNVGPVQSRLLRNPLGARGSSTGNGFS